MHISKDSFLSAGSSANIPPAQLERFWSILEKNTPSSSAPLAKWLVFFGGLTVILAMTWLLNQGWIQFGPGALALLAGAYGLLFAVLGIILSRQTDLRIASGILMTMAVSMVPLTIYGVQSYFSLWTNDEHLADLEALCMAKQNGCCLSMPSSMSS